jgi:DNA-binding NarL/FixJ family response regulator
MKDFRILIVEDVVVTSVAIGRSLEMDLPDCIVLRAQSLFEARLLLKTYDIHFFIIDIQLPDGSGIDFLKEIAAKNSKAAVVIVTATPLPKLREEASAFGVLHFMGKPVDVPLLRRLAREAKGNLTGSDTSFSGSLKKLTVMDVVQLKCLARATVRLDFTIRDLGLGRVFIQDGEITHAEVISHPGATAILGVTAFNEILTWRGGKVEEFTGALPTRQTIKGDWQTIMLTAAQAIDEGAVQPNSATSGTLDPR